ncbi:hypothetical protein ACFWNC_14825 [Streptomyces sp. NPDC058369]|uniref:hypothetical protein n=1 Tax=Streptomyces sp. NPDC058369 TaxID=3346462 RepID=UPI00364FC719
MSVTDREEREENLSGLSKWDLVEMVIDAQDGIKTFMELDGTRRKQIKKLEEENDVLLSRFLTAKNELDLQELDPSRLESALRMYVSELDYDIHKNLENGEEDGLDHYKEEVDYFLRCWDTAGEG